jgi:hypothetical protein
MGELFVFQGARSAIEGGTEVSTTTSKFVPESQTVEVDFLYLDLTCSRCRASDATLDAAVEIVRPVLDSVGAGIEVRKTLVEAEEQAHALGFMSSPTIMVNGRGRRDGPWSGSKRSSRQDPNGSASPDASGWSRSERLTIHEEQAHRTLHPNSV